MAKFRKRDISRNVEYATTEGRTFSDPAAAKNTQFDLDFTAWYEAPSTEAPLNTGPAEMALWVRTNAEQLREIVKDI